MNNVNFVFYHPHLDPISDRTLRALLKKISTILREIQYQEVFHLINISDISPSEKQSMRDRVKGPINHIDAYYLQKLEKGSIEITISLTAFGIWLLQQTIGESIKEAWLKSEMHKNLVSYLSGDARKEVLDRNIDRVLENWTFDNYLVEDVSKTTDEKGDINVRVVLGTPYEVQRRINENKVPVTLEDIIKESEKEIAKLDAQNDDKN
ncbi:hypothetical protein [Rheinheimera faecalis]|uniref:hypothetical protein n=1 Tax=Rheinheimera faecalis TaxID=2901141 RepID=UPI001E472671|nr:hypothetical protein [Rheinheimera faecalis]